jgi:hypothetical protein
MTDLSLSVAPAQTEPSRSRPSLFERVPPDGTRDADTILDLFVDWAAEAGFELYPAQEEALLEIMAGKHVILNTPTGSGKSLVALGLLGLSLAPVLIFITAMILSAYATAGPIVLPERVRI